MATPSHPSTRPAWNDEQVNEAGTLSLSGRKHVERSAVLYVTSVPKFPRPKRLRRPIIPLCLYCD
jgi:hypothetical protein